jgi:hypothetical protein
MNYEDILSLNRPVSVRHRPMPTEARAAQFAPFAALNGYDAAVAETARLTEGEIETDECVKAALDQKLQILASQIDTFPEAKFTYFKPDRKKSGGAYVSAVGRVKEIDEIQRIVVLTDNTKIPIFHIYGIRSDLFDEFE